LPSIDRGERRDWLRAIMGNCISAWKVWLCLGSQPWITKETNEIAGQMKKNCLICQLMQSVCLDFEKFCVVQ